MQVLVTGATGFVGRSLIKLLDRDGHCVVALSRSGERVDGARIGYRWHLGEVPEIINRDSFDVAIHLAHDFDGEKGGIATLSGTVSLCDALTKSGVKRQIFFSSYSAGKHSKSTYGRVKSLIEHSLIENPTITVVRPGLILGHGGIYGRMISWVMRWPIIPLPDGGKGVVPVVEIDRLCYEVGCLIKQSTPPKEFNAFYSSLIPLRELIINAAKSVGRRLVILPIPTRVLLPILRFCEYLSIRLPVTSDSLTGFVSNQSAKHIANLPGEPSSEHSYQNT